MPVSPTELLSIAVAAAEDKKAMNLVALDLKGISLIADYFVICHGNSDTQVQALWTHDGSEWRMRHPLPWETRDVALVPGFGLVAAGLGGAVYTLPFCPSATR